VVVGVAARIEEDATSSWEGYFEAMARNGVQGGELKVRALGMLYGRKVHVYAFDTEFGARLAGVYKSDAPEAPPDAPPISLSFYKGGHYDSLRGLEWVEFAFPAAVERGSLERAALAREQVPHEVSRAAGLPRAIASRRRRGRPRAPTCFSWRPWPALSTDLSLTLFYEIYISKTTCRNLLSPKYTD